MLPRETDFVKELVFDGRDMLNQVFEYVEEKEKYKIQPKIEDAFKSNGNTIYVAISDKIKFIEGNIKTFGQLALLKNKDVILVVYASAIRRAMIEQLKLDKQNYGEIFVTLVHELIHLYTGDEDFPEKTAELVMDILQHRADKTA